MKKYINRDILYSICIKSQIRIVLVISLMILSTSCEDFIDVAPDSTIDAEAFFSNADELVFALNGVYALQRPIFGDNLFWIMQMGRSDNVEFGEGANQADAAFDVFQEIETNNILVNIWVNHYIVINNANTVIKRAPGIPFDNPADEELINRATGEAKFLRAFTYFYLVTMWGEVPLRLEPTEDFDNANIARSSVDAIYAQIISDLTDAISVLPTSYSGGPLNEVGRATRYAAQALLGKVYLQSGNASAASAELNDVIGNYSLLVNYADIHAAGNDNTAESIFEVSFNPTNQTGLFDNNFFLPQSVAQELGIVAGGFAQVPPYAPTKDVQTIYEDGDLRAEASFGLYNLEDSIMPYISKFMDLNAAGDGSDINMVLLRYADVLLLKAEADGESAGSYELINQVRRRAFGQDPLVPDPAIDIDATTPGTFFEKVQLERRREFAFENQRWIDLLRHPESDVIAIMNDHLAAEREDGPWVIDAHNLLYPIPQFEIESSDDLVTQNPGYN
jgi:starch-binding outer membrane protein, SusD/RagB family